MQKTIFLIIITFSLFSCSGANRPKPERTQIIITERLRTFVVIVIFPAKLYLPKDLIVAM